MQMVLTKLSDTYSAMFKALHFYSINIMQSEALLEF